MTALRQDLEALMPEPVAWASTDWMRSITETELALIPNHDGRRTRCRLLYRIPLYTATQMRETILAATERAAKVCDGLVYALDNGGNRYRREADASRCAAAIRGEGEALP